MHRNRENSSFQFIDEIYCHVVKKLILDNKKDWIEYMLEDIFAYTNLLNFINGKVLKPLKHGCSICRTSTESQM